MNASILDKRDTFSKFSQLLLIDEEGYIVESCDSVFSTKTVKRKPIQDWLPFFESIFHPLQAMDVGAPEIRFSKVESPSKFLPGYYDFTFSKAKLEDAEGILWCIFDYTELYTNLMFYQQQHNELEIYRQFYELGNQKLKHTSEIQDRKNFFKGYLKPQKERNFYSEVHDLLVAPENALDIFAVFKNHPSAHQLDNLQETIDSFGTIKNDYDHFLGTNIVEGTTIIHSFKTVDIIQLIQERIERKLDRKIDLAVQYDNQQEKQLVGNVNVLQQILFHLLVTIFEQSDEVKVDLIINFKQNIGQLTYLVLKFIETPDSNGTSMNRIPIDLILRLSLVKKLITSVNGSIASIQPPNTALNLEVKFPCQRI